MVLLLALNYALIY